eukprot:scaffold1287_cov253-Ochromonas_danica.AAC.25
MANKKVSATVFVSGIGNDICNPFFDDKGNLHIIRQNIGTILSVDSVGNAKPIFSTGGQPSGAIYSNTVSNLLYVTDFAHNAVLALSSDGQQEVIVSVYEDRPLKGPNGIALIDDDIFFTDSGSFGETGLHSPTVTKDKKFIYVAETSQNRILRFFQRPVGVYHGSVFYTIHGGVGPQSLTLDNSGNLYIGHFDIKESSNEGNVFVVSPAGKLLRTITTNGAEISGLAIWQDTLYITERSTGSIFRADL